MDGSQNGGREELLAATSGFKRLGERFGKFTARAVRTLALVGIVYACLIGLAGWRFIASDSLVAHKRRSAMLSLFNVYW